MANFVKPIREKGMIISKKINEARQAGENFDGSVKWDARDEEYILEVISCDEEDFSKDTGFLNGTRLSYKVDKATYDRAKFGSWCNVKYTLNQFGNNQLQPKAESLILCNI